MDIREHLRESDKLGSIIPIAVRIKLFVCCFNTLKDVIPKQFLHKWMAEYYMIKSHINKDIERASNIQKLIAEKGYLSAISKGFVYSRLVYDDNYMRQYNDIDIYVDVDNIFEIGKSLLEEGYTIKALNNECIAKNADLKRYFEERDDCSFNDELNPSRPLELKAVDIDAKLSYLCGKQRMIT